MISISSLFILAASNRRMSGLWNFSNVLSRDSESHLVKLKKGDGVGERLVSRSRMDHTQDYGCSTRTGGRVVLPSTLNPPARLLVTQNIHVACDLHMFRHPGWAYLNRSEGEVKRPVQVLPTVSCSGMPREALQHCATSKAAIHIPSLTDRLALLSLIKFLCLSTIYSHVRHSVRK